MIIPSPPNQSGTAAFYRDGKKVEELSNLNAPPKLLISRNYGLDRTRLSGPKLKIERSEFHIAELERLNRAFLAKRPYRLVMKYDPVSQEQVFCITLTEALPIMVSAILGDIIHNIRTALDYLICDMIRANNREPDGGSGFPITDKQNNPKHGMIAKIKGVSAKTERLVLRLKPYKSGNPALWQIHKLDVLDKHAGIIAVAGGATRVEITMRFPLGMAIGPNNQVSLGIGPPSFKQLAFKGKFSSFKPVLLLNEETEIYRAPATFRAEPEGFIVIAFGRGQICEGQPLIETLKEYANLVKRIMGIFERRCL